MGDTGSKPNSPHAAAVVGRALQAVWALIVILVFGVFWLVVVTFIVVLSIFRADTSSLVKARRDLLLRMGKAGSLFRDRAVDTRDAVEDRRKDPVRIDQRARRRQALKDKSCAAVALTQQTVRRVAGLEHDEAQDRLLEVLTARVVMLEELVADLQERGTAMSDRDVDEWEQSLDVFERELAMISEMSA